MKIVLFYDNFIRDFRGLLFLKRVLEYRGNNCYLEPLFKNAIFTIKKINPDTVVMGQIGEYSTSVIGIFCFENEINLCLNTTEFISKYNDLDTIFKVNQGEFNDKIIDMQVLGGALHKNYIHNNPEIKNKDKYKLTGISRMDLDIIPEFINVETTELKNKYNIIPNNKKIYFYVSSFIYDETGGQIDKENLKDVNYEEIYKNELKLKTEVVKILNKFANTLSGRNGILLIKKHPWDKSHYLEQNLSDKSVIFVDNYEYIVPLIQISDVVLHDQSTVAIEAWMQKKRTISINPFFDGNYDAMNYHMKYDTIVKTYDELIDCIEHYPTEKPKDEFLELFNYKRDGKATIRVAEEINKLMPKETKKKLSISLRERLNEIRGNMYQKRHKPIPSETYGYLLYSLENQRQHVEMIYKKPIEKYIQNKLNIKR